MRFASLGSGSRGNATLIEADSTLVMVDCGFSVRETERRLRRLGREPEDISAILVTHEHSDHVSGVARLARRFGIGVWATPGTLAASARHGLEDAGLFNVHEPFVIGDLEITPVAVPHDAREPSQFVFGDGARRIGLLTDAGSVTPHIERCFSACDALIIECNHDSGLLAAGQYPPALKARVGGPLGHLSNDQAAVLLSKLAHGRLQHLVAAHLSEQNNTPERVLRAVVGAVGCPREFVQIIDQDAGLGWRQVC